jgi:fumarate hydratase subunit beta
MMEPTFDPFGAGDALVRLRAPLIIEQLQPLRAGQVVALSGELYVARDAAHARMAEAIAAGEPLPFDPAGRALYYMGPTPAPPGRPIGACGPTTASRMDPYAPLLIERGLRLMLGKGYRSPAVKASMLQHGCIYLGAVEGMAALLAGVVVRSEVIAYADLGPEAVLRLEVVDFPAVVVNDLHGGDLYISGPAQWARRVVAS